MKKKFNWRKNVLATLAALSVVYVGYSLFFQHVRSQKIETLNNTISQKKRTLDRLRSQTRTMGLPKKVKIPEKLNLDVSELQKEIKSKNIRFAAQLKKFVDIKQTAYFEKLRLKITNLITKNGIKLKESTPLKIDDLGDDDPFVASLTSDPFNRLLHRFVVTSSYKSILKLIAQINRMEWNIVIVQFDIRTVPGNQGKAGQLETTLTVII